MKTKGILIPIGGNEDKGIELNEQYTLEFISEGILYHVVKEAGGIYQILLLFQRLRVFLMKWVKIIWKLLEN